MELSFIPEKRFMQAALVHAKLAAKAGEIPVGATVICQGRVLAEGRNRRETEKSVLGHAEIEAIDLACHVRQDWRLTDCDLYVTLEPCPMCMGAILNARIKRVIFGAADPRTGCCGSVMEMKSFQYYRYPEIYPGFMEDECRQLMKTFFRPLR